MEKSHQSIELAQFAVPRIIRIGSFRLEPPRKDWVDLYKSLSAGESIGKRSQDGKP